MNTLQSSLTYAAGQLFFEGRPVAGFRTLKVSAVDVRVTVFKDSRDIDQVKAMKAAGVKVWSVK
jgi:hypothetical protein